MPFPLFNVVFLLMLALASCSTTEEKAKNRSLYYFDLKTYFQNEINRLDSVQPIVNKKVEKDGVKEQKRLSKIEWKNELSLFTDADINKPVWDKSYQSDTIKAGNKIILHYSAIDTTLPVKDLMITMDANTKQVSHISIHKKLKNFMRAYEYKMYYIPDSVYSIEGKQSVNYIFDTKFGVEGLFE